MSLVEKALKKMQSASPAGRPAMGGSAALPFVEPSGSVVPAERVSPTRPKPPTGEVLEINRAALRAAGHLPPEHQERQIADQYRQIKRPLIASCRDGNSQPFAHMVMVTSAMPGEGKTFTSVNLAISMSLEKDFTVVLIDGDAAKPHVSRLFGVENRQGLLDALRNEQLDVESLILPTDIPGLSILPAGHRGEDNATELFASERMRQIAARMRGYDSRRIAIIDTSPLLLTNESRVLASVMGQVVVVVRAGVTPQQSVVDALSYLGNGSAVGFVLNQSMSAPSSGYYYGHADVERAGEPQ